MKNISQLSLPFFVGQNAASSRAFSEEEVIRFSEVSIDSNPIHFDKIYASNTRFGECIVQGPLVASLIGGLLGSKLPGPGTIYISQNLKFLKPSFINERLTANVEITSIREDKPIIILHTWVEKENGEIVMDGEAVVLFLGKP